MSGQHISNAMAQRLHLTSREFSTWVRDIAVVAAVTLVLLADIGALEFDSGRAAVDQIAFHLWGPGV